MKPTLVLIPILAITVSLLIRAEMLKQQKQIYVLKPIATLMLIAMALVSFLEPMRNWVFSIGIVIGLVFSFGGDVALMFQEHRKAFMVGLVLFLLAHVVYTVTFAQLVSWSVLSILAAVVTAIFAIGFYQLVKANLGTMRLPVIIYIVVISIMVILAISTLASPGFSREQGIMIAVGAILFYISDIILAANRFWKPWQYHRFSLAFYYAGQAGIALAASYFG